MLLIEQENTVVKQKAVDYFLRKWLKWRTYKNMWSQKNKKIQHIFNILWIYLETVKTAKVDYISSGHGTE